MLLLPCPAAKQGIIFIVGICVCECMALHATSIPWAVRLSWLEMPIHGHFFQQTILTDKVGQNDLSLVCNQVL